MSKNEIVTKEFNLMTLEGELAEAISEELDGLGRIPFDQVKIPSGGGLAFELPSEDVNNPLTSQEVVGIILTHNPMNAYWEGEYNGSNDQPDCLSNDGKQGLEIATGELHNCADCPLNQFGSSGYGKACKNMRKLYILQENNPVPLVLTLPPTSLKNFKDYVSKQIVLKGMRSFECVTKITLRKEKSKGGIVYSKAAFSFVGQLSAEQKKQAREMAAVVKDMVRNLPMEEIEEDVSEETAAVAVENGDFVNVPDEITEDLPFN